ncbi:xanthine dehydrogenase small subunit [Bdellovibrio svalbardensis]|uniref:FAD binding domain-containing protein n=1 Tax=Bdellovibrio svalbardensis TaxID=2972972 RepID=A0ABT6DJF7_9BACT|nr:FAD binding domain-containing protein [Bdellovibrio svalbardensis]MDG0815986.1 FAD binding domain-containing protein [Bdellovibrio svalbardensis]
MSQTAKRNHIVVNINGETLCVRGDEAFQPLAQFLRNVLNKVGTKVVCAEGDCGACTVLASSLENSKWSSFRAINSCIAPVFLFDQAVLVTVEGVRTQEALSEVQEKMREFHGGQCGFCTPGMICSMSQLAEDCAKDQTEVTEKKARNYLTGNLCRCTGYEPILNAATHIELPKWVSLASRYLTETLKTEFQALDGDVEIQGENRILSIPTTLASALAIKAARPQVRIVAGATDLGVVVNKGKMILSEVLVLNKVAELRKLESSATQDFIGAQVTLSEVETFIRDVHPELKRLLHIFASPQIKNQATLLGNILNGSPIGDSIPALMALEAEIQFASTKGTRSVPLKRFYKGYKVFDKTDDEIAVGLAIPALTKPGNQQFWLHKFFKVSMRKDLDISAVTFAAVIKMDNNHIAEARLAMGGIGPCVIRLTELEQKLQGKTFELQTFEEAGVLAASLITPISDLRASQEYRRLVTANLFKKCFHELSVEMNPSGKSSDKSKAEAVCP